VSRFEWLSELLARCEDEHVLVRHGSATQLALVHLLDIDHEDWGRFAAVAHAYGCRWSAVWADQVDSALINVNACFEYRGDYLVVRAGVDVSQPVLPSQTPWFPAANRPERHVQDMFGIVFSDHPDARRWTRHQAWSEGHFPLRRDFPAEGDRGGEISVPDADYPFFQVQGTGVYEIPVGPVHAGIIEPGHFRFQALGETVLNLEERLGYVHKGIEKIAEGRDAASLARLAGRVCGDSSVAHAWAACMAMERAARCSAPPRALHLRAVLVERERIANHLGDIGAVCNDVGFAFAHYQFGRLRETWQRVNGRVFGHRLLMDCVIPGGVSRDLDAAQLDELKASHAELGRELEELSPIVDYHPSLEDRLLGTGVLTPETAALLGVVGFVGKASGRDYDLRRDHGYAPYHRLQVESPVFREGDVAARLGVRTDEIGHSLALMQQLLDTLPEGDTVLPWQPPPSGAEGLGLLEGWRGEVLCYVRFGDAGKVVRFFPRDPSWLNWPALEQLIHGNIVPDFPVCNKSVNASYSGHDL
jgi:Ni,Fe-hydrogenase III large subunit/NADH:ubiquinone oxidoreductase subunit C